MERARTEERNLTRETVGRRVSIPDHFFVSYYSCLPAEDVNESVFIVWVVEEGCVVVSGNGS